MNLAYLIPRLIRHFLPPSLVRFLLLRSILIKPGLETVDHGAAVKRYEDALAEKNDSLRGKRVLVFGYGGRFDIGLGLLKAGAAYVALSDRFAPPDDPHNAGLLEQYPDFLTMEGGRPRPWPERMRLVESDVRELNTPPAGDGFDLIASSSVYEHVEDAEGITRALARLTNPAGRHIHFVDLRDHFFKYPFEMLKYSESTWRRWLNPGSNHNRLRIWQYRRIFESCLEEVEISVLGRDEAAFGLAQGQIRPEFKSGNLSEDAVTLIRVSARVPKR